MCYSIANKIAMENKNRAVFQIFPIGVRKNKA
jgi:hypothetical protein